jgi:hypothetical protein
LQGILYQRCIQRQHFDALVVQPALEAPLMALGIARPPPYITRLLRQIDFSALD